MDKLEGLVGLWSKVIEQVLAESEQVGHTPCGSCTILYLLLNFLLIYCEVGYNEENLYNSPVLNLLQPLE